MSSRAVWGVCLAAAVLAGPVQLRAQADDKPDIFPIIVQAGSDNAAEREKALDALADMGAPGLEKLREIEGATTRYLTAQRRAATLAYNRLTSLRPPARRKAYRADGEKAFTTADYGLMARKYARLAVLSDADVEDCLWNGHARQLAGKWRSAVAAYRLAFERIDYILNNPPPRPKVGKGGVEPGIVVKQPGPPAWSKGDRQRLLARRAALALLIGRLLRHECNDPDQAAAVFASAAGPVHEINRSIDQLLVDCVARFEPGWKRPRLPYDPSLYYVMQCLQRVPACKEQTGQFGDALSAWNRACAVRVLCRKYPGLPAVQGMARVLGRLEPDRPLPPSPWLIMLTPRASQASLKPAQAATRARSYRHGNPDSAHWRFAVCPPPGKEFEKIEFACDIEQHKVRYGGHFSCSAAVGPKVVELGGIRWKKKKPGRDVVRREFKVPRGTGLLLITTGSWKGNFTVHEVKMAATFRQASKPDKKAEPETWIQQELLPAGGKCTRNGKPFYSREIASRMAAGRYVYTYHVPGRKKTFRAELDLKPARRYGLFVNLDSPFTHRLTNLVGFGSGTTSADADLARLPDGRWLVAYCSSGNKIMFAASKDLVTWTKPWPLPTNSMFSNLSPALMVDKDGTIHLAYFSNRLHLESASTAGYRLWLMRSDDARKWSAPRHVAVSYPGGSSLGSIQMLRGHDGRCWIFWRDYAAVAKSPDDIHSLQPIKYSIPVGERHVWNPHVTIEADGKMHMVFDDFNRGVYYTSSPDGTAWSVPIRLVEKQERRSVKRPLLVRAGKKTALIHMCAGTWLRTGTLGDPPRFGRPVKITGHVADLNGSRPYVTAKGELILFAGKDSAWIMRAKLSDIFEAVR